MKGDTSFSIPELCELSSLRNSRRAIILAGNRPGTVPFAIGAERQMPDSRIYSLPVFAGSGCKGRSLWWHMAGHPHLAH